MMEVAAARVGEDVHAGGLNGSYEALGLIAVGVEVAVNRGHYALHLEAFPLGHIEGAYNIPWKSIVDPANLAKLPTDEQIVVYCYTGHTGQVAAALLRILGYDAINLKFGMMGWTDDDEILGTGRLGRSSQHGQ